MATLTWIGGGNNSAGNPKDWSGDTTPKPNDYLDVANNATINVTGNQLQGDTINFTNVDKIDTINITGATKLEFSTYAGDDITVNLAKNSEWVGGYTASIGSTVNITGSGVWYNHGYTVANNTTNIGVNVVGNGTIFADQSHALGTMTFLHGVSVGSGQLLQITGNEQYSDEFSTVDVQSPLSFHAAVDLGFGQLDLDGLHGTSYSLKNDLLSIFNGKSVVDTLRLTVEPVYGFAPQSFGVSQTAAGISIHADGVRYATGGTLLALHG